MSFGRLCTMDDVSNFLVIQFGPEASECEKNVIVMLSVVKCGFNKHASSRRDKLKKSTFAQSCRSFDYVLLVTQLVTRFHRASCQVKSSQ